MYILSGITGSSCSKIYLLWRIVFHFIFSLHESVSSGRHGFRKNVSILNDLLFYLFLLFTISGKQIRRLIVYYMEWAILCLGSMMIAELCEVVLR